MDRTIGTGLSAFLLALTLLTLAAMAAALRLGPVSSAPGDTEADRVFGQGGSFTSSTCNLGASSLCVPHRAAVDSAGNLYVVDQGNNRVLEYNSPLTTDRVADRVFGQGGSFFSNICNLGGISASSLCSPDGVAVDGAGNLYVSELANNHRVLEYDSPLTTDTVADRVFGQPDFTSVGCRAGLDGVCNPSGMSLDAAGNLYVADISNHRVLEYNSPLTTDTVADRVFGQGSCGTSASSFCSPRDVAVDGAGNLYVADGNSRGLEFDSALTSDTVADRVFGQGGSFTSDICNLGGISASSLCFPVGVAVDTAGNLYAADNGNNRVLKYDSPLTTDTVADRAFGHGGSFTSNTCNLGGISASSLCFPFDAAVDSADNLYVLDRGNDRVLEYDDVLAPTATPTPCSPEGCPTPTATPTATATATPTSTATPGPSPTPTATTSIPSTRQVTLRNDTGQAASDLHITFNIRFSDVSLVQNAPGCPTPSVISQNNPDWDAYWVTACVDPTESVTVEVRNFPGQPAPDVDCFFWTLFGEALPSPDPCGPTATPTATPSPTVPPTPAATNTPVPTATPAPGLHDGKMKRIAAAHNVRLSDGTADVEAVSVQVRNDGDHTESFAVYLDILPPGGITNPYGCTPVGRIVDTVVTLAPGQQTSLATTQTFNCADVAGALGQTYTIMAAIDVHANDGGACAVFELQSVACFNALADDDDDDADNRVVTNAFRVR